ncbi:MAG: IS110 family transposase [Anaerolineae bacterium]|nr:IS110 family transposase [Anaerolineae bacterium]
MLHVGLDWGMQTHHVCLMAEEGQVLSEFSFSDDLAGFEQLRQALSPFEKVVINIERQDGLLVNWLVTQGYEVRFTPPLVVAHRRPRRTKNDRGDAYLLAYLLRLNDADCRPLPQQSDTVLYLRQLVTAREDVLKTQRQFANRLIHVLRRYYPAVLAAFPVHHSLIMQDFLMAFPSPEQARALSITALEQFLKAHHYSQMRRLQQIFLALRAPAPVAKATAGYQQRVLYLAPILRMLETQRNQLDRDITVVFRTHPEAAWWSSFPGLSGPLTPAYLLAWIGDDRNRFPTAAALQAVAGTCPISRRSGRQSQVEFRQACSHELRHAIVQMARLSIRKSGWARSYFHSQLEHGHSASRAYRALANCWIRILWKLWQTGGTYDEAIHLANRARKGSLTTV